MVTKPRLYNHCHVLGLILAKIHMVTKLTQLLKIMVLRLILAKIHMVTKPQIHVTIYSKIIKY